MAEITIALIDVASIHRGLNTGLGYLASSITTEHDIQVNVFSAHGTLLRLKDSSFLRKILIYFGVGFENRN